MSSFPAEGERRRRLITRTLPLALVALIAFIVGAATGSPGEPEKEAANRYAEAWEARNFKGMYGELNEASKARIDRKEFEAAYREAQQVATAREVDADDAGDVEDTGSAETVPVEMTIGTVAFGEIEAELALPFVDGGVEWDASLVFPGLEQGEELAADVELAERAPILARDGSTLAEGPAPEREHPLGSAAIDVTGEVGEPPEESEEEMAKLARRGFPPETPVGISGLERAFNARLAGKPGGSLLAVSADGSSVRTLAKSKPRPGAPVKTTIDPDLQEAAVSALAGRSGGVAVLDTRNGDVRALAGQAFSAPQPPGSTFKVVTTTTALESGAVSMDDEFEISDGINVGGRFIYNANGEFCGGTFRESFAHSCNAVFAPLGPAVGNDKLVETSEKFGFNEPPSLYAPQITREVEPEESTIPTEIGEEIDLAVSAIGQGEVLATPLEMASVSQTVANGGVRLPTSIVLNKKLRPEAEPVRVMSKKTADELTELMVGVVTEGTGFAGAITEAQVAGKTGTAELGPKPGQEEEENPVQIKDAWFTAFAPAEKPRLAVGVLLIEAEASGGEVAAPIASAVLSAGL
ncbi:MAG TPA: penicillin-binding transpeptidase domain-containing protein [Solirubrobacterales bacterium]|nr:penicillin-binding transpeptidase domain-containing protein [Solirubrobacterales bacterium]